MKRHLAVLLTSLSLVVGLAGPARAQSAEEAPGRRNDEAMLRGDKFFKRGHYLRSSEEYRVAALADPANPWKKLAFGHSLFAIGNYSYASYALRRGIDRLGDPAQFRVDVVNLFPSDRSFQKAMRDLKRYVTYAPRDPSGLTVLGYMYYASGEEAEAAEIFRILKRLDPNDPFPQFFEQVMGGPKEPEPPAEPEEPEQPPPPPEEPPEEPPPPVKPPVAEAPQGLRSGESTVKTAPKPKPAVAK